MQRYRILAAAIAIEVLFGFQYTWAIFDRILQRDYGLPARQTQLVFSAAVVFFAAGMMFSGRVMERLGPRLATAIGAVVYGCGLIVAGMGKDNIVTLVLGAGVMMGLGIAIGYMGPVVVAVKWFGRYKGIAMGLVVGAFGAGSSLLGAAVKVVLGRGGSIFATMGAFGAICMAGIVLASLAIRLPADAAVAADSNRWRLPAGILKTPHFWALVVGFFAGTFAGLSIIGSLESIGETLGAPEGFVKVGILVLAAGNAAGRVGWGVISELAGTRRAVVALLGLQAAFVAGLLWTGQGGAAFVTFAFLIGFNYGGNFVLYVTEVARAYGSEKVAAVYGLIFGVYCLSGIGGPSAAGFSKDLFGTYAPSMIVAAAVAAAGAIGFAGLYRKAREADL